MRRSASENLCFPTYSPDFDFAFLGGRRCVLFFCLFVCLGCSYTGVFGQQDSLSQKDSLPVLGGKSIKKGNIGIGRDTLSAAISASVVQDTLPSDSSHYKISIPPSLYTIRQWERAAWAFSKKELPPFVGKTLTPRKKGDLPDPSVAWLRALIFPGWGQAYNRRYWKIPIVYATLGASGYLAYNRHRQYKDYQKAYLYEIDDNPNTSKTDVDTDFSNIDAAGLRSYRVQARDFRDRMMLITAVFYALQIVEAYVDAHLQGFDVSENLSIRPQPILPSTLSQAMSPSQVHMGIGIHYKF